MGWLWSDYGLLVGYVVFSSIAGILVGRQRRNRRRGQDSTKSIPEQLDFPSDLEQPIAHLLKSGIKGASLEINFENLELIILFQKYIQDEDGYGIVMLIPEIKENDRYFEQTLMYCKQNTVHFTILTNKQDSPRADASIFHGWAKVISIDFKQNTDSVLRHLRSLVVDAFGIPETTEIFYKFRGGTRPGELVDSPEQTAFSTRERGKHFNSALRARTGLGFLETIIFTILILVQVFGYFAFIYSIVVEVIVLAFSVDSRWSAVTFDFLGLSFKAKWFDIVWVGLFLLTFLAPLTRSYWVDKLRREDKDWRIIVAPNWRPNGADLGKALESKLIARGNLLILLVLVLWVQF